MLSVFSCHLYNQHFAFSGNVMQVSWNALRHYHHPSQVASATQVENAHHDQFPLLASPRAPGPNLRGRNTEHVRFPSSQSMRISNIQGFQVLLCLHHKCALGQYHHPRWIATVWRIFVGLRMTHVANIHVCTDERCVIALLTMSANDYELVSWPLSISWNICHAF